MLVMTVIHTPDDTFIYNFHLKLPVSINVSLRALLLAISYYCYMLPAFDRFESLIMLTLLQNIVILGAQGLLMLMGSKFLMMTRLLNKIPPDVDGIVIIIFDKPQNMPCFAAWSSLLKILIPSTLESFEHLK